MRREPGVGVGVLGAQVRQGARVVALPHPEVVVDAAVAVHGHVLGLARRDGGWGELWQGSWRGDEGKEHVGCSDSRPPRLPDGRRSV